MCSWVADSDLPYRCKHLLRCAFMQPDHLRIGRGRPHLPFIYTFSYCGAHGRILFDLQEWDVLQTF